MKTTSKLFGFLLVVFGLTMLAPNVQASSTTLGLSSLSGDQVQVAITGEPNSTIQLSFWPTGAASITTIAFGTTNASGNFTTSLSSGGYGIPAGSPTYATINGVQSAMQLWPNYTSSVILTKTSVQIAVGQSLTIGSSSAIILASNSFTSGIRTAVSGSQLTVTGLSAGTGNLAICGTNVGCASLVVTVGSAGQTQVSFNPSTITMTSGSSKDVTIFGTSRNGYRVASNSNVSVVEASISGSSDTLSLFVRPTITGTATISVCSVEDNTNCAPLYVTAIGSASSLLTFSQNNFNLIPGLTQNVTVSGGPDANYYISSNSNSGVASVTLSGTNLAVIGGSTTGATTIKVCSTSLNATCGDLTVNNNADTTTASVTTLSFSQNVVSVFKDSSSTVTVTGGTGTGYAISSNSNPTIATASISGNSNIVNISGNAVGSTIITICSATVSATCASIYVTVTSALEQISFNQSSVTIMAGEKAILSIFGEKGTKTVSTNNSNIVTPTLNNDGNILLLATNANSGSAIVTICSSANIANCASINVVINSKTVSSNTPTTETPKTTTNSSDQLEKINDDVSALVAGTGVNKEEALKNAEAYLLKVIAETSSISSTARDILANFIANGSATTKTMGAGERAGVVSSYKKAFGKLPATDSEWLDVVKIANGRWPSATSASAVASAKVEFAKVYKRAANMDNTNDNAAISIIAYGLRPTARNTNSEKSAIKSFRAVYAHDPISALAWDIVRAIAYSGASR